jgi:uncharacterized cupredoxin-like copper-binding protein
MKLNRRIALAPVAAVVAGLALSPLATANTGNVAREAAVHHAAATKTIQVQGGEFFFKLSSKTLAKPGTMKFVFKNIGHVEHDFDIHGKKTPLLEPGKSATLTVNFTKKGKYAYLCTVPGHAEAGMKGVFTVR